MPGSTAIGVPASSMWPRGPHTIRGVCRQRVKVVQITYSVNITCFDTRAHTKHFYHFPHSRLKRSPYFGLRCCDFLRGYLWLQCPSFPPNALVYLQRLRFSILLRSLELYLLCTTRFYYVSDTWAPSHGRRRCRDLSPRSLRYLAPFIRAWASDRCRWLRCELNTRGSDVYAPLSFRTLDIKANWHSDDILVFWFHWGLQPVYTHEFWPKSIFKWLWNIGFQGSVTRAIRWMYLLQWQNSGWAKVLYLLSGWSLSGPTGLIIHFRSHCMSYNHITSI